MQLMMDTSQQCRRNSVILCSRYSGPVCLQQGATNDPPEGQVDKDADDSNKAGMLDSLCRLLPPRTCLATAVSLASSAMPSSQLLQPARAALSLRLWLPRPRTSVSQMRLLTIKASLTCLPSKTVIELSMSIDGSRHRPRSAAAISLASILALSGTSVLPEPGSKASLPEALY